MTTQVYYRKWRPSLLSEVVGQPSVTQTLRRAIEQERLAHAYLFCGPRGTGKTSTARILAKAMNCGEGEGAEPCNRCSICTTVNEGTFTDLVEIDAASNRGIDEIRDLREKVNFLPGEADYKVYIIDEVHMLTEAAFNAFLKTLEEPPRHTVFILCTTEAHKLPATIVSRCQRHDFRRIPLGAVVDRLSYICGQEGVEAEEEALRLIARAAWGSLRDAENLLEQMVTSFNSRVEVSGVRDLLGLTVDERSLDVVKCLVAGNTTQALEAINTVAAEGLDLRPFLRQIVEYLRAIMLLKTGAGDSLELPKAILQELEGLGPRVELRRLLTMVRTFGQIDMRYDSPSPLPLEMAVVECELYEAVPAPVGQHRKSVQATGKGSDEGQAGPDRSAAGISTGMSGSLRGTTGSSDHRLTGPLEPETVESRSEQSDESIQDGPPPGGFLEEAGTLDEQPSTAPAAKDPPKRVQGDDLGLYEEDKPEAREIADPSGHTVDSQNPSEVLEAKWPDIVKTLSRHKGRRFNIGALLRDCRSRAMEGSVVKLYFSHSSHLERVREEMEDPECRRGILQAFHDHLGASVELILDLLKQSEPSGGESKRSHLVQAAMAYGARIVREKEEKADGE